MAEDEQAGRTVYRAPVGRCAVAWAVILAFGMPVTRWEHAPGLDCFTLFFGALFVAVGVYLLLPSLAYAVLNGRELRVGSRLWTSRRVSLADVVGVSYHPAIGKWSRTPERCVLELRNGKPIDLWGLRGWPVLVLRVLRPCNDAVVHGPAAMASRFGAARDGRKIKVRMHGLPAEPLRYRWNTLLDLGTVLCGGFIGMLVTAMAVGIPLSLAGLRPEENWFWVPLLCVPPLVYAFRWFTYYSRQSLQLREDAIAFTDHKGRVTEIPWGELLHYETRSPARRQTRTRHWPEVSGSLPWRTAVIYGRRTEIRCWPFHRWEIVEDAVGAALRAIDRRLQESR